MSENNENSNKIITIKVRLSDEDYHDITIAWSEESCEHKQQLFMRKIASFMRIPVEYLSSISVYLPTLEIDINNTESNFQTLCNTPPRVNETFIQTLNDGDCFYLKARLGLIDHVSFFDFAIRLYSIERGATHPTECTQDYCQHINTRSWLNKRKEIMLNSELMKKIRTGLPEERFSLDEDLWLRSSVYFNIKQYYDPCCHLLRNVWIHLNLYLRYRG